MGRGGRTLVVRPRLGAVRMRQVPALVQRPHDAQRCPVRGCGQAAGVAVGQHAHFAAAAGPPGLQLGHDAICSYPPRFLQAQAVHQAFTCDKLFLIPKHVLHSYIWTRTGCCKVETDYCSGPIY